MRDTDDDGSVGWERRVGRRGVAEQRQWRHRCGFERVWAQCRTSAHHRDPGTERTRDAKRHAGQSRDDTISGSRAESVKRELESHCCFCTLFVLPPPLSSTCFAISTSVSLPPLSPRPLLVPHLSPLHLCALRLRVCCPCRSCRRCCWAARSSRWILALWRCSIDTRSGALGLGSHRAATETKNQSR